MSAGTFAGAMLRARRSLAAANPELLDWAARRWADWLRMQRSGQHHPSARKLTVVVSLSCMADLPLHVGLMQLLAVAGDRCAVVLSLATDTLARIVRTQARREGWEALVKIVTGSEVRGAARPWSPNRNVVELTLPTVLELEQLNGIAADETVAFVGREFPTELGGRGVETLIARLSAFQPDQVQLISKPDAIEPPEIEDPPLWRGVVHSQDGAVDVVADDDGELLVRANPGQDDSQTIARLPLCPGLTGDALTIRVPPDLLTESPQPIRIERWSFRDSPSSIELLFQIPPSQLKPWMISAFLNRGGAGNPVIRAFAGGIGCRTAYAEDEPSTLQDIPVVWGVLRDSDRILTQAKAQGLYYFYVDHAYFNRGHGKAYRIARNAHEAGPVRSCPRDRLDDLQLEVTPWRRSGRDVLVCPPTDYFMHAHGCEDWLETTLATLNAVTDRPVIVRQKPKAGEPSISLREALETAHALVTHSSNVAIEAVCMGTPVFVAESSAAAAVGRTDLALIETPRYPDRHAWLAHLAYAQYSFDEIADGTAWRLLLEAEEREFV